MTDNVTFRRVNLSRRLQSIKEIEIEVDGFKLRPELKVVGWSAVNADGKPLKVEMRQGIRGPEAAMNAKLRCTVCIEFPLEGGGTGTYCYEIDCSDTLPEPKLSETLETQGR
jgi:hypothetical protein